MLRCTLLVNRILHFGQCDGFLPLDINSKLWIYSMNEGIYADTLNSEAPYEMHRILRPSIMHCYIIIFIIRIPSSFLKNIRIMISFQDRAYPTCHYCFHYPSAITFSFSDSWAFRLYSTIKIHYHPSTRPVIMVISSYNHYLFYRHKYTPQELCVKNGISVHVSTL